MQMNITTFANRRQHYIHEMMESLFRSDWRESDIPVNLIMGSEDESHVQEYGGHPAIRIVPWDAETDPNLRFNCTLNKIRALRYGDDDSTLICEDDITFFPDWIASLSATVAELEDERYVLSLFAAHELLAASSLVPGKTLIRHYPTRVLQGAQAIFYPSRAIRNEVADFLTSDMRNACGDELIGQYARSVGALYSTKNVLVSHIGAISCFQE
jgi:hypothetical protein